MTNPVIAHTLPNGMLVLLKEAHGAPVATSWIWYRVGSRNEVPGCTGVSHWVEHMLFKGTPQIPVGQLDRLISRNGGISNGFTWIDYTAYYETLPADRIALGLQIESDRMVNALFEEDEIESERTVIISELEGYANEPETWLDEAVKDAAFTQHPYRHPVIGYRADLERMSRADLYAHYQTFYVPNNAVLVLVGDFDTDTMLRQAEDAFAQLPVGPPLPPAPAAEPEPQAERRVTVRRPGAAAYIQIGYLAPDCRNPDFAALAILDSALSGAKSLTFMGGGTQTNRSARLYPALVECGLSASAWSSVTPSRDSYLFELGATASEGVDPATVEAALIAEVTKIQQDGIAESELARARKQMRAQVAYGGESVTNQAMQLGMWESLDTYRRVDTLLDELASVSADDVRRVAQAYLTERRRIVGHFVPSESA